MEGVVAAIVAVAGTLLGSALTYVFQRQAASRVLVHEFGRQLRADRLAAYSDFLTAMTEFRRAEIYLSRRESADPEGAATAAADADSWRLRATGLTSAGRVRLLAGDRDVVDAANRAALASEGILTPQGNGRGRYYIAGEPIRQIQEHRRARRPPLRDPHPWMRATLGEPAEAHRSLATTAPTPRR
jgi:hypothetical protein